MEMIIAIFVVPLWFLSGFYSVSLLHAYGRKYYPAVVNRSLFKEWLSSSFLVFTIFFLFGSPSLIAVIILNNIIKD